MFERILLEQHYLPCLRSSFVWEELRMFQSGFLYRAGLPSTCSAFFFHHGQTEFHYSRATKLQEFNKTKTKDNHYPMTYASNTTILWTTVGSSCKLFWLKMPPMDCFLLVVPISTIRSESELLPLHQTLEFLERKNAPSSFEVLFGCTLCAPTWLKSEGWA
jgi:hypothetical protein